MSIIGHSILGLWLLYWVFKLLSAEDSSETTCAIWMLAMAVVAGLGGASVDWSEANGM